MQKLGAVDANFLYTESDLMPNHVASVQRFELPAVTTPQQWIASLRDYVFARRDRVDYLHRKLQFVPGNFDHPMWVEATDLSMDKHIIEFPLPAPGTAAQLEQAIADIHARRMDRSRPLWAMYVVTGLEDGDVAVYNQIHHAAIDGLAGQVATMLLMDTTPEHETVAPGKIAPEEDGLAAQLQLSLENMLKYQIGSATRMFANMETMRRLIQRAVDPSKSFGALTQQAPKTPFNRAIGRERRFSAGEFAFSDVRSMGKQLGCTVNDMFMAICAGGLRRYLQRKGELPESSLIAGCPVSLRRPGDNKMGNQVTMMNVGLATEIDDPKLRLLAIHESAAIAKEVTADLAEAYDGEISFPGLPTLATLTSAASERARVGDQIQMPINVVISNVPGPRDELFFNGARMLTHYPVSIPAHGAALNITVQSYGTRLYFGITACAAALPDAEVLRDDMLASFVELKQALMTSNVAPLRSTPRHQDNESSTSEGPKSLDEEIITQVA